LGFEEWGVGCPRLCDERADEKEAKKEGFHF
jgi:hypothetical protein